MKNIQPLPYQIDYTSLSSGKKLPNSKRRVRWVFGFANMSAIKSNVQGVECRGEEHEIVLVASIANGKRMVLLDGTREMHRSVQGNKSVMHFTCSFEFGKIHHAHIEANLSLIGENFELYIDGQSFIDMDKLYELGMNNEEKRYLTNNAVLRSPRGDALMIEDRPAVYSYPALIAPPTSYPMPITIKPIVLKDYHAQEPQTKEEEQRMLELALKESLVEVAVNISLPLSNGNSSKSEKIPQEGYIGKARSSNHQNEYAPTVEETWQDLIDFSKEPRDFLDDPPLSPPPQHFASHAATPFDSIPVPDLTATCHPSAHQPQSSAYNPHFTNSYPNNANATCYIPTNYTTIPAASAPPMDYASSYPCNCSNNISQFDINSTTHCESPFCNRRCYTNHPYSHAAAPGFRHRY